MKDHLERAAIALLNRVKKEAEGAVDLTGLADLANSAAKLAEAVQGKIETAGVSAVKEYGDSENGFMSGRAEGVKR